MPTYNDEDTILNTIDSLYQQDYDNWQLIIINDGGNDLKDILANYLTDKRILLIQNINNKGQVEALKTSLSFIQGELVASLNSDDILIPHCLKRLVAYFDNIDIDGIFCDLIQIDESNTVKGMIRVVNQLSRYSAIDVLLRNGQTGLISDNFFCRVNFFFSTIVPHSLSARNVYWLSLSNPFNIPHLIKVPSWYQYRVYANNYIHSEVGKFLLLKNSLNIIYKLSAKYVIIGETVQSYFWRGIFKISFFKNIYSYIFHPLFTMRKQESIHSRKYYQYLYKKFKQLAYKIYGKDVPVFLGYILEWYQNVLKNKRDNILKIHKDEAEKYKISSSDIDLFRDIQNQESNFSQILNFLSQQAVTEIEVDNKDTFIIIDTLISNSGLPISIRMLDNTNNNSI